MLQFSSRLTSAIHFLLYIEKYQDIEKITSEVLAITSGVNKVNVRKILIKLKEANLIYIKKGIGGSYLKKSLKDISVKDLYKVVEDTSRPIYKLHGFPNIQCPIGRSIEEVLDNNLLILQKRLEEEMEKISLKDLYLDMEMKITPSK